MATPAIVGLRVVSKNNHHPFTITEMLPNGDVVMYGGATMFGFDAEFPFPRMALDELFVPVKKGRKPRRRAGK